MLWHCGVLGSCSGHHQFPTGGVCGDVPSYMEVSHHEKTLWTGIHIVLAAHGLQPACAYCRLQCLVNYNERFCKARAAGCSIISPEPIASQAGKPTAVLYACTCVPERRLPGQYPSLHSQHITKNVCSTDLYEGSKSSHGQCAPEQMTTGMSLESS